MPRVIIGASEFGTGLVTDQGPWLFQSIEIDQRPDKHSDKVLLAPLLHSEGFPGGSDGKESACNAGGPSLIPGLGRSSGEGNSNPL